MVPIPNLQVFRLPHDFEIDEAVLCVLEDGHVPQDLKDMSIIHMYKPKETTLNVTVTGIFH